MSSKTEKRQTAAEIKAEIVAKTTEMKEAVKNGTLPLTSGVVAEINASESTPVASPQTASKPEPVKAAEPAVAETSIDYKEWAKKKGIDWTTDSNVLSALHKSDQEFHKKRAEEKVKEASMQPSYTPAPVYMPPPAYTPPPPSQRQLIEDLARANNMTPEDFERVARVSREVYEANAARDRAIWQAEMEKVRLAEQKNSVFRELSSDPVFRNPQVAIEFHNVLEQMQSSDPVSFEKDPIQYKKAYERAVFNIGRRNLEGKPLAEGVPPQVNGPLPSLPPKPFGQGSGGGYNENETTIDPQAFAAASLEDKRKILEGMGLRSQYQ